jgi:hypothetical protein
VQSELHVGENLVWSGVPDARRAAVAAIPETLLLVSGGSVRSIKPGDIFDVKYRERRNGSGEVMIRTDFSVRSKNLLARKQDWLYGVPNAKEVAGQVSALTGRQTVEPAGFWDR